MNRVRRQVGMKTSMTKTLLLSIVAIFFLVAVAGSSTASASTWSSAAGAISRASHSSTALKAIKRLKVKIQKANDEVPLTEGFKALGDLPGTVSGTSEIEGWPISTVVTLERSFGLGWWPVDSWYTAYQGHFSFDGVDPRFVYRLVSGPPAGNCLVKDIRSNSGAFMIRPLESREVSLEFWDYGWTFGAC